jgi:hypothetical protein
VACYPAREKEAGMRSYVFKIVVERDKFDNGREAVELYVQDLVEAGETTPVEQGTIELPEPAVVVNL